MESTDVLVVPMEPKEALATAELISSVIQSLSYYNARAKEEEIAEYSPEKLVRSVEEDPHSVLVAKRGKEVVGFCLSRYDDGLIWLAWFGVKPEYRRQGIASQLLITLKKRCASARPTKSGATRGRKICHPRPCCAARATDRWRSFSTTGTARTSISGKNQ